MIAARIQGATRYLGAPAGWVPEDDGPCAHLAILDTKDAEGHEIMVSCWYPSPEDLAALNAGAAIQVSVLGTIHPIFGLGVSEVPKL